MVDCTYVPDILEDEDLFLFFLIVWNEYTYFIAYTTNNVKPSALSINMMYIRNYNVFYCHANFSLIWVPINSTLYR